MAVKSYILIETEVGTAKQVALSLGEITHSDGEIKTVELVTGPFDVICLVEAENLEQLGSCITDSIQPVAGVKRTTTCLTIQV